MAAITIATARANGVAPGAITPVGTPGVFMLEYVVDSAKQAVAAADTLDFFEIPAYAGIVVDGASIEVVKAGTASGTIDIQLVTTDVTGLTGWASDAAAGTKLVKLATAGNTVVNTSSATYLRLQQNTAAMGGGVYKVRVWGTLFSA